MEYITQSAGDTKKVGEKLSDSLKNGGVVAFSGDLGSGKTTFIQGLAKGLGIKERIISPTFIILRNYGDKFYHADLYRLEGDVSKEVENLGLLEILNDKKSILVIEWAEKIKELLKNDTIWVEIKNLGDDKRLIKIA